MQIIGTKKSSRGTYRMGTTWYGVVGILLLSLSLISGCVQEEKREQDVPPVLRIGVLPDEQPEILNDRYALLLDYLADHLQIPCRLVVPDTYAELLELFHEREVDLAYFGGYTFVQARSRDQAIPLVMRLKDTRFTSLFIVSGESEAQTLTDLEAKAFSFGSQLSTSGHLMPRYFLRQQNITPETFFHTVLYSGTHDKTAYWVRDGLVDVGVANAAIIRSMMRDRRLEDGDIRILWETPPYADYVWAVHPDLGEHMASRVRMAFLNLTPENERHGEILSRLKASGFIPADHDDYSQLEMIVKEIDVASTPGSIR